MSTVTGEFASLNRFFFNDNLLKHFMFIRPEAADTAEFVVEDGDVILVATDGVFDNVPESELISELKKAQGLVDSSALQAIANSIAWMARSLSFDGEFMSPFAENARNNGIYAIGIY